MVVYQKTAWARTQKLLPGDRRVAASIACPCQEIRGQARANNRHQNTRVISLWTFSQVPSSVASPDSRFLVVVKRCRLRVTSGRDALKLRCPLYPRRNLNVRFGPLAEVAGLHSSNSSARISKDNGTSIPSILATRRLMRNSTLVGNSTGRSAGLVPLRIRST